MMMMMVMIMMIINHQLSIIISIMDYQLSGGKASCFAYGQTGSGNGIDMMVTISTILMSILNIITIIIIIIILS
jgi:hypothetical protein